VHTFTHAGRRETLGFVALLASGLAVVTLGGVGVAVECDAARCRLASGAAMHGSRRLTIDRASVDRTVADGVLDAGGVYRGGASRRVACSNPQVVLRDVGARYLYPVEVCPLVAGLDLVHLRQWVSGARPALSVHDWIVGIHLGTVAGLLLAGAWVVGLLLGRAEVTVDGARGIAVRRGGLATRARFELPAASLVGAVTFAPDPAVGGVAHLYVETRDGRWHHVSRHAALSRDTLAALRAMGLPHGVRQPAELSQRAPGMTGRVLVGVAVWTLLFGALVVAAVAAAFVAVVPALPA
jgi:hypothetical protein